MALIKGCVYFSTMTLMEVLFRYTNILNHLGHNNNTEISEEGWNSFTENTRSLRKPPCVAYIHIYILATHSLQKMSTTENKFDAIT